MFMQLKKKYRTLPEPTKWVNDAGHHNVPQFGTNGGGGNPRGKKNFSKGAPHPVGLTGRSTATRKRTL